MLFLSYQTATTDYLDRTFCFLANIGELVDDVREPVRYVAE